ncbi:MAG: xanthine dehydrogenase accessory protein XdhC [Pseudomonadota bacterium]
MSEEALRTLLDFPAPLVLAEVTGVKGSAPRGPGARMLVSAAATAGSIGGGRLEWEVTEIARRMLQDGQQEQEVAMPLGPALGQCCGGNVRVTLRQLDRAARAALASDLSAERAGRPTVLIFGAGHTGLALARTLRPLPLTVRLIDSRSGQLVAAPEGVEAVLSALPEAELRAAPSGSAIVVMTHDHGLDFLLTAEALSRGDAAYVGLIGSATKRARFERFLEDQTLSGSAAALTCPIGAAGLGEKRPEIIALHAASEIMAALSTHRQTSAARPRRAAGEAG